MPSQDITHSSRIGAASRAFPGIDEPKRLRVIHKEARFIEKSLPNGEDTKQIIRFFP